MMLVVALSDGPGEYNRREALRKYAMTNYVEKVAPEYSKEGPPPEAYRDSEKLYEARLKRLKPKVNLILMGDGYNHRAIRATE